MRQHLAPVWVSAFDSVPAIGLGACWYMCWYFFRLPLNYLKEWRNIEPMVSAGATTQEAAITFYRSPSSGVKRTSNPVECITKTKGPAIKPGLPFQSFSLLAWYAAHPGCRFLFHQGLNSVNLVREGTLPLYRVTSRPCLAARTNPLP